MKPAESARLKPGDRVALTGLPGNGTIERASDEYVVIRWDDETYGVLYPDPDMAPNVSRLYLVGGTTS